LEGYDPCKSWVSKIQADGKIACDLFMFVNNERVTGPNKDLTWQASHALASKQSYLGIQDAARKAHPSSKTPRAWAGAIVHVLPELGVCVLTSAEKWAKMKGILEKWWDRVSKGFDVKLLHKELMSDRGFLIYVTRTYPAMIPYLKGFHLTIEMWRGGRNTKGWKVQHDTSVVSNTSLDSLDVTKAGEHRRDLSMLEQVEDEDVAGAAHRMLIKTGHGHLYAPGNGFTTPVPRFQDDIAALIQLTDFELPPLRIVRPSQVVQVYYGFGDASGKQFGAPISQNYNCRARLAKATTSSMGVRFWIGLWTPEEEEESSNYKELRNLVDTVKEEAKAGWLRNCDFFLFTDNSTAESCFYWGTLKSRHLHGLVLKLCALEMAHGMTIHVIHVSGKRMIT
jgi:hypothetical protein